MCNFQAIAAISGVSTGIRAFGVLQQTRAATQESRFKSRIASNNATIALNNADRVLEKSEADVADERRKIAQRLGAQRAQIAGAGFQLGSGTTFDILGDTAALGELDVLRIEETAENDAANFRSQASNFQTEVALGRVQRKNIKRAGRIKIGTTLIGGGTRAGAILLLDKNPSLSTALSMATP